MHAKDKKIFYLIWGIAWLTLSILFSAVVEQTYRAATPRWYLECWFAMFPVAWTIALLWARNRERLRIAISRKSIGPLLIGLNLLIQSNNQLMNGAHHSTLRNIFAGIMALSSVLMFISAIAISVAEKKQKTASSAP